MAILYAQDLLSEARLTRKASGYEATRKFLVTNSNSGELGQARLRDALNVAQIPDIGDAHPQYGDLLCEKIDSMPVTDSASSIHLVASYTPPNDNNRKPSRTGPCVIECSAVTVDREYVQDRDGKLMFIGAVRGGVSLPPQPVKPKLQFPMTYIIFKRLEPKPFTFDTQKYVGSVNNAPWVIDLGSGYPPRSALCTAIRTTDEGSAVRVRYEFQAFGLNNVIGNNNTFDVPGLYKDAATKEDINSPLTALTKTNPTDVDFQILASANAPGGGIPLFKVYSETNFNELNLH